MNVILDFLALNYKGIFIFSSISFLLLVAWYFSPSFKRRFDKNGMKDRKEKEIFSQIKDYLDEDGRLVLEKLSRVWREEESSNAFFDSKDVYNAYKEGMSKGLKNYLSKIESAVGVMHEKGDDEVEDSLSRLLETAPKEEVISVFSESLKDKEFFKEQGLSEEEVEEIHTRVLNRILNANANEDEEKKLKVQDMKKNYLLSIYLEEIQNYLKEHGRHNLKRNEKSASEIAEEYSKDIEKEEREIERKLMEALKGSRNNVDGRYRSEEIFNHVREEGNSPESLIKVLLDAGFKEKDIKGIQFTEKELYSYWDKIDLLQTEEGVSLLKFFSDLYKENLLYLFIRGRFDFNKLLKDFILYFLDNFKYGGDLESRETAFSKFIASANYYTFLRVTNTVKYLEVKKGRQKDFLFLPIVMSYLYEKENSELFSKFLEFFLDKMNLMKKEMIKREFKFTNFKKKTRDGEFEVSVREVSMDSLGFSFKREEDKIEIYMFPKALDLYFGYYSLAIPYIMRGFIDIYLSSGREIHVNSFLIRSMNPVSGEDNSKISLLSKVVDNDDIVKNIYNQLRNKESKIKGFQNIIEVSEYAEKNKR